jgi:imidazolonepropionase-like amidohydrolase
MSRLSRLAIAVGSWFVLFACATQTNTPPASGLVVSDVTVISPERIAPLEHAYVRIHEGRIAEVSERPLRGEQQLNGEGRFLIPGLIDSHVHLAVVPGFPSGMKAEQAAAHPSIVAATLAQDPRSYLYFGFTTLVDLIGSAERTARWNALDIRPDAWFCGAAAISKGKSYRIMQPSFSYDPAQRVDATPRTIEDTVAAIAADGAICVKTFLGAPEPSVTDYQALVTAAHKRDLLMFVHARSKEAQAFALGAGVDVIVHGMWGGWEFTDDGVPADVDAILSEIAKRQVGYQPTAQVIAGLRDMIRSDYLGKPELADAYPTELIHWYETTEGRWYSDDIRKYPGFRGEAGFREGLDRGSEATQRLFAANARLLFGSDTPSDRVYTNPPGLNGRLEMDNWIAAGVSKEKLFRALTIDNARMLRLDDRIGTVERGKVANLLLLRANPLESVQAFDTIETVFLHGRPIPRAELSARKGPAVSASASSVER